MSRVCIFCHAPSESSRSVEHIVPESLGNEDHVLPPGIVCDGCNDYFARKIENPVLSSPYFVHARFANSIPSKRRRVPMIKHVALGAGGPAILHLGRDPTSQLFVAPDRDEDETRLHKFFERGFRSIIPAEPAMPDGRVMARFLGKMAMEALAARFLRSAGAFEDFLRHPSFEPLRRFVRYNECKGGWPFNRRSIYPGGFVFVDGSESYEVLHEFDFLWTPQGEGYFVFACFGTEYALNIGGPELDGYVGWLAANGGRSPLYPTETLESHSEP